MAQLTAQEMVADLGVLLPGDAVERLIDEASDPMRTITAGQAWRLGETLIKIGEVLQSYAKADYVGCARPQWDCGVIFSFVGPSESVMVDSEQVRKDYPERAFPELYKTSKRRGYVSAKRGEEVR